MIKIIFNFFISSYRLLFSFLISSGCCRYIPTCSSYAKDSFNNYHTVKACLLVLKRLGKCHPWGGYGYDSVPTLPCSTSNEKVP